MTEEKARKIWDDEVFDILTKLRTKLTESISEIFLIFTLFGNIAFL